MIIYISGAITGTKNNNELAFNHACLEIKKMVKRQFPKESVKTINPNKIGKAMRKEYSKQGKGEPEWTEYMRACIKKLCEADCAFFLPNWAESKGASLERHIAQRLDIPCADNMEILKQILTSMYKT